MLLLFEDEPSKTARSSLNISYIFEPNSTQTAFDTINFQNLNSIEAFVKMLIGADHFKIFHCENTTSCSENFSRKLEKLGFACELEKNDQLLATSKAQLLIFPFLSEVFPESRKLVRILEKPGNTDNHFLLNLYTLQNQLGPYHDCLEILLDCIFLHLQTTLLNM